jgi:hypothetical protein
MAFPPEWHALGREAELAAEQIAGGITALGRADHIHTGLYTQAFFGLATGLERIAKLIVVGDYAIRNKGRFPDNDMLRAYGHDVRSLIDAVEPLASNYLSAVEWRERPSTSIHAGITDTLSEFGKLSRYYNLDLLSGGKAAQLPEPIRAWWERVGSPILDAHYKPRTRMKNESNAAMMEALVGSHTSVLHHNEKGEIIGTMEGLSRQAGATAIVQKFGRLYTLQLVRWLSTLIGTISTRGAYEERIKALRGLDEPFVIFRNTDAYLRDRKTWSIYRL